MDFGRTNFLVDSNGNFIGPDIHAINKAMSQSRLQNKPKRKRANFTYEENSQLLALIDKYGHNWKKIAQHLEGRTPRSCKDHYENVLSGGIIRSKFTDAEDMLLLQLYQIHGPKWSTIAHHFPNRTTISLRNRYASLATKYDHLASEIPELRDENPFIKQTEVNFSINNNYANPGFNYGNFYNYNQYQAIDSPKPEIETIHQNKFPPISELEDCVIGIQDMYKISALLV